MAQPGFDKGIDIAIQNSIGVAHLDLSCPRDTEELIRHADEAMYAAKAAGKHRVMVRDRRGVRDARAMPLEITVAQRRD